MCSRYKCFKRMCRFMATCSVATLDTKFHPTIKTFHNCIVVCCSVSHQYTSDIDECALRISGCNQICNNSIGSYVCSCYLGYQISSNNKTCTGKQIWQLQVLTMVLREKDHVHVLCHKCAKWCILSYHKDNV